MARPLDTVNIEVIGGGTAPAGVFDNFTTLSITNDLTMPSEAAFEVGDDGTWSEIADRIAHGTQYSVFINGRKWLTGRVEMTDVPVDAGGGAVVRFTIRTKLADAMYASADPVRIKNASVKDFIVALYSQLEYSESDFIFRGNVSRDLLTGVDSTGQGEPTEVDLEPLKIKDAKVKPPETIYDAADRHLRRHGFMHWDAPDGKIVVSAPNDTQDPIYRLQLKRGPLGRSNNFLSSTRRMDISGVPSQVVVYGSGGKSGSARMRLGAWERAFDVEDAGFRRPVVILASGLRTLAEAGRAAAREMADRSKNRDSYEIETDGLSYWDGSSLIPWGVDTVVDIDSDVAGGALGAYYLHRVILNRSPGNGDTASLSLLKRGLWKL